MSITSAVSNYDYAIPDNPEEDKRSEKNHSWSLLGSEIEFYLFLSMDLNLVSSLKSCSGLTKYWQFLMLRYD